MLGDVDGKWVMGVMGKSVEGVMGNCRLCVKLRGKIRREEKKEAMGRWTSAMMGKRCIYGDGEWGKS